MADEVHNRSWRRLRAAYAKTLPTACGICDLIVRPGDSWDLSHVKPRALGGTASLDGLFVAHSSCNQREGPKLQWLVRQRQTPNAPPSRDWFGGPPSATSSPKTVAPSRIW
jgi:5-methylcytosine-specific restriction endonuclease McrA